MEKHEIISFINANPACYLATVEGDKPHVRGMLIYRADKDGIIFHTGKVKDLHKQLMVNPKVELCFNNHQTNVQVRVSGVAELQNDTRLIMEIVESRPFLKQITETDLCGCDLLAVYRVKKCMATVWTMETNLATKTHIKL